LSWLKKSKDCHSIDLLSQQWLRNLCCRFQPKTLFILAGTSEKAKQKQQFFTIAALVLLITESLLAM
jgi:hypothetical protein